jgi:hypothetical protein
MLKKNKSKEKESNAEKKKQTKKNKKKEKRIKHQTKRYCTFPSYPKRLNKRKELLILLE